MNYEVSTLVRINLELGEQLDDSIAEVKADEIIDSLYDIEEVKNVEIVDWDMTGW